MPIIPSLRYIVYIVCPDVACKQAGRQAGRQAVKESYAHAAVGTCKQASRLQRCSDGSMQASKQAGVVE